MPTALGHAAVRHRFSVAFWRTDVRAEPRD